MLTTTTTTTIIFLHFVRKGIAYYIKTKPCAGRWVNFKHPFYITADLQFTRTVRSSEYSHGQMCRYQWLECDYRASYMGSESPGNAPQMQIDWRVAACKSSVISADHSWCSQSTPPGGRLCQMSNQILSGINITHTSLWLEYLFYFYVLLIWFCFLVPLEFIPFFFWRCWVVLFMHKKPTKHT